MTKKITNLMLNWENYEIREYVAPGWQPWADTLAYYPLTSQTTVNDMSGNWYNLTNHNSTSFWTYNGVDCAYFDNNSYQGLYINSWNLFDTYSSRTFSLRINRWTNAFVYYPRLLADAWDIMTWCTNSWVFLVSRPYEDHTGFTIPQSQWMHIVMTHDDNTHWSIYKNWELYDSYSLTRVTDTWKLMIWIPHSNVSDSGDCWNWNISELIIENKVRTAQEVGDYYDQTKWNYWIS